MRMEDLPKFLKIGGAVNVLATEEQGKLYNKIYEKLFHDRENLQTHAWDYQFGYAILKNGGLSIVPSINLIHNIGAVGTHSNSESEVHKMTAHENYKIEKEPKFVIAEREYEILHFNTHIRKIFGFMPLYRKIIRKVKTIIGF
jgi:GT2 family glycosyltransferase